MRCNACEHAIGRVSALFYVRFYVRDRVHDLDRCGVRVSDRIRDRDSARYRCCSHVRVAVTSLVHLESLPLAVWMFDFREQLLSFPETLHPYGGEPHMVENPGSPPYVIAVLGPSVVHPESLPLAVWMFDFRELSYEGVIHPTVAGVRCQTPTAVRQRRLPVFVLSFSRRC